MHEIAKGSKSARVFMYRIRGGRGGMRRRVVVRVTDYETGEVAYTTLDGRHWHLCLDDRCLHPEVTLSQVEEDEFRLLFWDRWERAVRWRNALTTGWGELWGRLCDIVHSRTVAVVKGESAAEWATVLPETMELLEGRIERPGAWQFRLPSPTPELLRHVTGDDGDGSIDIATDLVLEVWDDVVASFSAWLPTVPEGVRLAAGFHANDDPQDVFS